MSANKPNPNAAPLRFDPYKPGSQPFRCPVCFGKGIVDAGFYSSPAETWPSSSTTPEKCRSCDGTGIVWS